MEWEEIFANHVTDKAVVLVAQFSSVQLLSRAQLFATPWTIVCQAPLSMGFSRQEYWSGLPFSSSEDLPSTRIEPGSPTLWADSLLSDLPGKPGNPYFPAIPISLT